ncbi:MAG: hypothetical protein ACJ8CB_19995 [Ktedonobacteraceae bacterium]
MPSVRAPQALLPVPQTGFRRFIGRHSRHESGLSSKKSGQPRDFPEPRDGWWEADKSATPLPGADKGRHDKSAPTLSLRSFAYNEFIHPLRRQY